MHTDSEPGLTIEELVEKRISGQRVFVSHKDKRAYNRMLIAKLKELGLWGCAY